MRKNIQKMAFILISFCIMCSSVVNSFAISGDADGNGMIMANDAAIALQYTLNGLWLENSDVNDCEVTGDGIINAADAAAIMQKALNSSFEFVVEEQSETTTQDFDILKNDGNIYYVNGSNADDGISLTDINGKIISLESEDNKYKAIIFGETDAQTKQLALAMENCGVDLDVVFAFVNETDDTQKVAGLLNDDVLISSSAINYCPYTEEATQLFEKYCGLMGVNPEIVSLPLTVLVNNENRVEMVGFGDKNISIIVEDIVLGNIKVETTQSTTETTTVAPTTEITTQTTTMELTTEATTQTTTLEPTTETTTQTTTVDTAFANKSLTLNGTTYYIGQAEADLPVANRIDAGFEGCDWYVYNNDYQHYTQVGVKNGVVKCIYTMSTDLQYRQVAYNSDASKLNLSFDDYNYWYELGTFDGVESIIYFDKNDNNRVYGIMLKSTDFRSAESFSAETMASVENQIFDITNAYRAQYGLPELILNEMVTAAAKLHAQDMAQNSYFGHVSTDGKTFEQRIAAQGVHFRAAAENIVSGEWSAMAAVFAWVQSAGHRENLLNSNYRYTGVGMAYNWADTMYHITRYVQDFCA